MENPRESRLITFEFSIILFLYLFLFHFLYYLKINVNNNIIYSLEEYIFLTLSRNSI